METQQWIDNDSLLTQPRLNIDLICGVLIYTDMTCIVLTALFAFYLSLAFVGCWQDTSQIICCLVLYFTKVCTILMRLLFHLYIWNCVTFLSFYPVWSNSESTFKLISLYIYFHYSLRHWALRWKMKFLMVWKCLCKEKNSLNYFDSLNSFNSTIQGRQFHLFPFAQCLHVSIEKSRKLQFSNHCLIQPSPNQSYSALFSSITIPSKKC